MPTGDLYCLTVTLFSAVQAYWSPVGLSPLRWFDYFNLVAEFTDGFAELDLIGYEC